MDLSFQVLQLPTSTDACRTLEVYSTRKYDSLQELGVPSLQLWACWVWVLAQSCSVRESQGFSTNPKPFRLSAAVAKPEN